MISKRDVQLGKVALKEGFISKDQLTKCLALKKKLAKDKGKKVALGALLLKKGYLTKEQLEECVKIHNKALEAGGEEAPKKKRRRSKRSAAASTSAADASAVGEGSEVTTESADASAEQEAVKPKRKRKRKAEAGGEEDEPEKATATATRPDTDEDEAKSKRSKTSGRSRRSRRSSKEQPRSRRLKRKSRDKQDALESAIGAEVESAVDAVDPAIFTSADESETETETRRLIACPDCAKRYRVKRNQVGKRFACRRCKHRIKVPKDLFERETEVSSGSGVEEFVLGSGSDMGSSDSNGSAPSKAPAKKGRFGKGKRTGKGDVAAAAAAAAAAVDKVGKGGAAELSIAELAMQATKHKPKPLKPRTVFGPAQMATAAVLLALLVGMGFGSYTYFVVLPASKKEAKLKEQRDARWLKYKGPLDEALGQAKQGLEAKEPKAVETAILKVRDAIKLKTVHLNDTVLSARATAYEEELKLDATLRDMWIQVGKLYLEKGGTHNMSEGLRALVKALELPGVDEGVRLLVARTQITQHRYKEAAAGLREVNTPAAQALRGLAYARWGKPVSAEKAYKKLEGPLTSVLIARAWLAGGKPQRAIQEARNASGLTGLDQAAAKLVEAAGHEKRRKPLDAARAYDLAVASGQDSPIPLVARAEFHLRNGRAQAALKDADAARSKATTARGLLARGDALLAMLQTSKALASYREAAVAKPAVVEGLLGGEVDPFEEAGGRDHRVVAQCRIALLLAAEGKFDLAVEEANKGVNTNPFEPAGLATLAMISVQQDAAGDNAYLDRAIDLITAPKEGDEGGYVHSLSSAFVLFVRAAQRVQKARFDEAIEAAEQAIKIDPSMAAACNALIGTSLARQSHRSKSARRFLKAATAEGQDAAYQRLLKRIDTLKKEGAGLFLRQSLSVLAHNPYHAQVQVLRARALLIAERGAEALQAASRAIELNPHVREAYLTRAFLYLTDLPGAQRNVSKGGEDLTKAEEIESSAGSARLHYGKAEYFWQSGEVALARKSIASCLQEDANFALAYRLRATILTHLNEKDEAAKALEKFKSLSGS